LIGRHLAVAILASCVRPIGTANETKSQGNQDILDSKTATFTGFPHGKDIVEGGVQLYKEGSTVPVNGFTYEVKSCGENIDAGAGSGTYTVKGTGNYESGVATDTYAQTTKDVTVTVLKAQPVPATVSGLGWSYDGTERRLVVAEGAVAGVVTTAVAGAGAVLAGWRRRR
jgi:hypothetical protein